MTRADKIILVYIFVCPIDIVIIILNIIKYYIANV